jgi:hypothetical protein
LQRDLALAYPDYSQEFQIYTDTLSKQLGAVITQGNRPIAFFSRPKTEILAIVSTLKKFKSMVWWQVIKVYTDHKNLIQVALGLTSQWRLLLEQCGPKHVHIKCLYHLPIGLWSSQG